MANQVVNWVYSDQDDVRWFNTHMDYALALDTQSELYKYFASTYYMEGRNNIYDNRLYEGGLIIRPLTSEYGKTGIMCFDVTHPDAKWRSSARCCYGQAIFHDLVHMVFVASGLKIDPEYLSIYRNRVLTRVIGDPGLQQLMRSNVCIENSTGGYKTLAYVDKQIVDRILEAMAQEGMFTQHYEDLPEVIEAGTTLETESLGTLEQTLDVALSNALYTPAVVQFRTDNPQYANWIPTVADVMPFIEEGFSENGVDISEYEYYLIRVEFNNPILGYTNDLDISVTLFNFTDNELTNASHDVVLEEHDDVTQGYTGWQYVYNSSEFMSNIPMTGGHYDRPVLSFSLLPDNTLEGNYIFNQASTSYPGIYNMSYSYITEAAAFQPKNYKGYSTTTNFGFEGSYPVGISKQEDADAPKNVSTLSTDYWPTWDTNSYMITEGYALSNVTYVALGFGNIEDDEWTQARVQLGEIVNDHWQERLGANMENIDEYNSIEEDYGGDDDGEKIKPDPNPTPTPTPGGDDPSLASSRLFTVHQLSNTEVDNLGNFLYSNDFISAIQNMFTEPMNAIIGCFVLNHGGTLPTGASETLKLGSIMGTTGVTGTKLTNQFQKLDCGGVNINEYYNNVEDYDYSTAQIYLPYIGFRDLDVKEIMGARVNVVYFIDCFSGACLARVYVTKNSVQQELYNFTGNCAISVPLTGRDFTRGVTSMLSGALGVIGGAATGNAMAMAFGATNMIGDLSTISRSGALSANIGAMGCQTPFIVIKRPVPYNALNYPEFYGIPSNWTVTLGTCSGYTRVKDVHLDDLNCTDQEREEILMLLKQGVIF